MNQELMTLDFWQDTVIYEGKTLPVGALACDALNVSADTITKMNEQCEKINLLLGILNAGVFHHGGQCLDVYPEQFRSVCIRHPSRRKIAQKNNGGI